MTQTKITLVGHGELDLDSSFPIPLNFDINDVRDISTRNGMWSKTVKIPGTNNNNSIFESVFNVNIQSQTFNPQVKVDAIISVDGLSTLEAVFQLRKINKKYLNDEDYRVVYDCYLKSETSSFYSDISGKYLTDLDLSEYNHDWDISIVEDSMTTGNWTDGYQYWLGFVDNKLSKYEAKDLIPAIYAKTYWDKIFSDAGYTYEFDELYDVKFDKLIIPFNGDTITPNVAQQYRFAAGISTGFENLLMASFSGIGGNNSTFIPYGTNQFPTLVGNARARVLFDDESTSPWFDPNSLYNNSTGEYRVIGYSGNIEFNTKYKVSMQLQMFSDTGAGSSNNITARPGFAEVYIRATTRVLDINGSVLGILNTFDTDPLSFDGNDMSTLYSTDYKVEAGTFEIEYNSLFTSDQYPDAAYIRNDIEYKWNVNTPSTWLGFRDPSTGDIYRGNFYCVFYAQADTIGHFNNSPQTEIQPGSPLYVNDIIPNKVKQSDFILSLVKMHNIYIQPDRYDPTHLIVKTRDRFYADGSELDWTKKVDTKSIDVELISNTQKKRKIFTYKVDDKDEVSKSYIDQTNEVYGQFEYLFENEFIKDVDKVEPIFSPTFITTNSGLGFNNDLPIILTRNPKNNIRILYTGSIVPGIWVYYNGQGNIPSNFTGYSTYKFAGHLYPNAKAPEFDLHFGICDYYSHTGPITNNNLYNQHYFDQMNIFDNGHIMTAYFKLTFADITALDMDERIYVHDSWWNINKIFDYNAAGNELTKVELITADTLGEIFTPNNNVVVNESRPTQFGKAVNKQTIDSSSSNTFGTDVKYTQVLGSNNVIQPGTFGSIVAGSNNQIAGSNNIVVGDNNKVRVGNTTAIGISDVTFDEPDGRVYATTLVRFSNFISAGRDEVLGKFPDNKVVNHIDGGRDDVRPLGGQSIETNIDAGKDSILYRK